ncbi:hypothetical protein Rhsp01_43420 [Rhizobium sp. NBRC 114257]|uniref:Uncharacterized protein n=1 Tax=Rhizobium dioscoreae TaxID=2653122 RepID=A0ABQ0Z993_9HYPH|nr:hypothetical protein RsS93_47290 [Rhizobium dioscoreae]GLU83166.1 hypothetical protein Rhsp01_43420 [Rhizobium sp. NBRC 114257]
MTASAGARLPPRPTSERCNAPKVRVPLVIEHNGLAIENGGVDIQFPRGIGDSWKVMGPIVASACNDAHTFPLNMDTWAIAVSL